MSILTAVFNEVLFRPFFNILILFYNFTGDFGVAIILLTILIRLFLYPLSQKAIRSQKELSDIQPEIKEIQKKYKNNQQQQAQELMRLYKEKGINPFAGCLPLLIQFPVFLALFAVLKRGLEPNQLDYLYNFISQPALINSVFLGILDLKNRSIILALLVGVLQLIQSYLSLPKNQASSDGSANFAQTLNKQMVFTLPIVMFVASISLPAGIALYLAISTLFSIGQQVLNLRTDRKNGK